MGKAFVRLVSTIRLTFATDAAINTTDIFDTSPYHYVPTESICILFVVLFSISTAVHVVQALWFRHWFLFLTVISSGLMEIAGWSGRLWSSINPFASDPFTIQITLTIIGPTPLLAANFVIFGRMIRQIGPQYSRMTPRFYTKLFVSCDVISLIVQAAGGVMASGTDVSQNQVNIATHIMQGGIFFQLVVVVAYMCLASEVFIRYWKQRPVRDLEGPWEEAPPMGREAAKRLQLMIYGLAFMAVCLFIRSVYRGIELTDGWNGHVIATQVYFNALDGGMIVLTIYTLNFLHPGFLLRTPPKTSPDDFAMSVALDKTLRH
ncbi:hypothetical protein EWM64_g3064 [Hericium alpestre]|uniref:RTA1 like protein n=1 Tax=Hericium alpestre TaxID=135208 RepID=A0A4Z0A3Y1_9AGAM|nr:hypothetical protein EWM64_g3064 [Hericium alpestre]